MIEAQRITNRIPYDTAAFSCVRMWFPLDKYASYAYAINLDLQNSAFAVLPLSRALKPFF